MSAISQSGVDPAEILGPQATGLVDAHGVPVPKALQFLVQNYPHFDVEYAEKGKDIIYHFWPPKGGQEFCEGFAKALENGFKSTLPPTADVRAEYTSKNEATVLMRFGENKDMTSTPRETYFVRVVGGTEYPLGDIFLKNRVFENIEKAVTQG